MQMRNLRTPWAARPVGESAQLGSVVTHNVRIAGRDALSRITKESNVGRFGGKLKSMVVSRVKRTVERVRGARGEAGLTADDLDYVLQDMFLDNESVRIVCVESALILCSSPMMPTLRTVSLVSRPLLSRASSALLPCIWLSSTTR